MSNRMKQDYSATPIAQLLIIAQIADLLCVRQTMVCDFIKNGGSSLMKLGNRSTRVDSNELQQYMKERSGSSAWGAIRKEPVMRLIIEKIRRERPGFPHTRRVRIIACRNLCGICGQAVPHHRYTTPAYACLCRVCYQSTPTFSRTAGA